MSAAFQEWPVNSLEYVANMRSLVPTSTLTFRVLIRLHVEYLFLAHLTTVPKLILIWKGKYLAIVQVAS